MGRVEFIPMNPYRAVEEDGGQAAICHYAAARLSSDGYLTSAREERFIQLAAPATLPDGEMNYRVVIDVPGDFGGRREYLAHITAGTTVDLVDIIRGRVVTDVTPPPSPHPRVRINDLGNLEAANSADVIDVGGGILKWRDGLD
jgi:hypothetical protein